MLFSPQGSEHIFSDSDSYDQFVSMPDTSSSIMKSNKSDSIIIKMISDGYGMRDDDNIAINQSTPHQS